MRVKGNEVLHKFDRGNVEVALPRMLMSWAGKEGIVSHPISSGVMALNRWVVYSQEDQRKGTLGN